MGRSRAGKPRIKISKAGTGRERQPLKSLQPTKPMKRKAMELVPKQAKRRVLKGQISELARAGIFAKQQREQRVRSIIGRKGRGKLTAEQQQELRRKTFHNFRDG